MIPLGKISNREGKNPQGGGRQLRTHVGKNSVKLRLYMIEE